MLRSKEKKTTGLALTNYTTDQRFFFFEIDINSGEYIDRITNVYRRNGLDVCQHRTGLGWHWISPTLLSKETWRLIRDELKDINVDCPMITLRLENNKYINEEIWFNYQWYSFNTCRPNSIECINLLNAIWKIPDDCLHIYERATVHTDLKIVNYPLPK